MEDGTRTLGRQNDRVKPRAQVCALKILVVNDRMGHLIRVEYPAGPPCVHVCGPRLVNSDPRFTQLPTRIAIACVVLLENLAVLGPANLQPAPNQVSSRQERRVVPMVQRGIVWLDLV